MESSTIMSSFSALKNKTKVIIKAEKLGIRKLDFHHSTDHSYVQH
jgi:hypothetical protein